MRPFGVPWPTGDEALVGVFDIPDEADTDLAGVGGAAISTSSAGATIAGRSHLSSYRDANKQYIYIYNIYVFEYALCAITS